jgi:DNA polymerase-3 subunit alpha
MAFIKIADLNGEIELILFPNAYQQTIGIWQRDQVILVNGKISAKDRDGNIGNEVKILVDDAREVTPDQAAAYQETGKTAKVPKASKSKKVSTKSPPEISASAREIEKRVYIRVVDTKDHKRLNELKNIVDQSYGITPLVLVIGDDSEKQIVKLPNSIDANEKVLGSLTELFGNEAVKFQ